MLVSIYERIGPVLADFIRPSETRRAAARSVLEPIIALARAIDADP